MKLLLIFAFIVGTQAISEDHAKEAACFDLKDKVVPLDVDWASSLSHMYYPLMSRMALYRFANDVSGKEYNEISESSLYYDFCFSGVWNIAKNGSYTAQGFNRESREYWTKPLSTNLEMMTVVPKEGKAAISGTVYSTMTDNSTYIFFSICSDDGQMGFLLATPLPKLPKCAMEDIREHAISLGFKEEFFVEMRYDTCKDKKP